MIAGLFIVGMVILISLYPGRLPQSGSWLITRFPVLVRLRLLAPLASIIKSSPGRLLGLEKGLVEALGRLS